MKTIKNLKDIQKCLLEITELEEGFFLAHSSSYSGGIILPKSSSKLDEFSSLMKTLHLLDITRAEIKKTIIELYEPNCETKKMVYNDMLRNCEAAINIVPPLNMN